MALNYPDVIGDYIDMERRYANSGLQYVGYFEPAKIAPDQTSNLYLFLQNNLNVPVTARLKIDVPKTGGFFSARKPLLAVENSEISIEMSSAEAGLLTLPVTTTEHIESGQHNLTVEVKPLAKSKGKRIRPTKSKSQLDTQFIDSPVGLDLVSSLGATYVEESTKKASFPLEVSGKSEPLERAPRLQHEYHKIWTEPEVKFHNQAVHELNTRKVKMKNELEVEKLYINLYGESVSRFADAGLPMRIGEAITMAKILTYSAQYFLSSPKRSDGLLVPIWERAFELEVDTTGALDVIRTVGFYHLLKVSVAISFGVIAQTFRRQLWSKEERQAVANYIAENVEVGQPLDLEFMYLPLLMAGTQICSKVRLQGEDVGHTLALMRTAREARTTLFMDEDMSKADKIYDRILKNVG